jgi:Bacterial regulatory protein, Fis family
MPAQKFSDTEMIAALRQSGGNRAAAARVLGVTSRVVVDRAMAATAKGLPVPEPGGKPAKRAAQVKAEAVEFPVLPDGKVDIDELISRRRAAFERRSQFAEARKLVPIKVRSNEPIAVCMLGDPHVDDDGTDLGRLQDDIAVIRRTPGLYAACVGDLQNNWIGRLARLWAHQETTASQAWQLVEWFVHELRDDWLFMVQGNHDHWSGAGDPLRCVRRTSG